VLTYSPVRHICSVFAKKNPIQLTFFVTRRCNARCSFCFYLSGANITEGNRPELSLAEIDRIASSMGPLLWLAFSGGEIFLRDDIDDIAQLFYEKNRPSIMLFPTNGLLTGVITEKVESILRTCTKSTVVVKLSLEGPEDLHDSIRGEGSFKKTMKTYDALGALLDRHSNFELGINTLFCSKTQDTMDELVEFVNGLDHIKTHTVSLIRGSVGDNSLKDVDMEKYHETITKLASNLRRNISSTYRFRGARLKAAQDIVQRGIIHKTVIDKRQVIPCYAGKLNLVLTESGDVYPCESFTMKLGNIRDSGYSMKHITDTPQAKKIINSIQHDKCFCTHECYLMTNILFNPRLYPRLAKEYCQL
jgi:radical SAM protein with 4Fe4S-binding SPASM domain